MGHPTLTSEQVSKRNEEIVAYAAQHPELKNPEIGLRYGLNRETVRQILFRAEWKARQKRRIVENARQWGFRP